MEKCQIQTPAILKSVRGAATMMARALFNRDKKTIIDESVKFWENALEYVRSDEYTPETYNLRFGDVPFAWCRRMESIDSMCDECDFFDGEWCGHAPFVNKLQPETSNCMSEDVGLDEVEFGMMSKEELANNIKAFIKALESMRDD
jgi:hypothetical protein